MLSSNNHFCHSTCFALLYKELLSLPISNNNCSCFVHCWITVFERNNVQSPLIVKIQVLNLLKSLQKIDSLQSPKTVNSMLVGAILVHAEVKKETNQIDFELQNDYNFSMVIPSTRVNL